MPGDYDAVMITARCSRCSRTIQASFRQVRETGVFGCICGTLTSARYTPPAARTLFGGTGGNAFERTFDQAMEW